MKKQDILDLLEAGENSGVEFKLDSVRPEQLATQFTGIDPDFEAGDDYFRTVIMSRRQQDHTEIYPEEWKQSVEHQIQGQHVPENVPKNVPEKTITRHLLSLIKENLSITYNELALATGLNRRTIQRHIKLFLFGSDRANILKIFEKSSFFA